jgi:hypothetical protein
MSPALTAEAFGTLLALSELKRIRLVEPKVRSELLERGLAVNSGEFLVITREGRHVAHKQDAVEALGLERFVGRRGTLRTLRQSTAA